MDIKQEDSNVFKGRTLAVISDFSLDERIFLLEKARQLKEAFATDDRTTIDSFCINNPNFGIYTAILENSTRTKQSFINAAQFHNSKHTDFRRDESSFPKGENFADTFNMLIGYANNIFVVRSKLEGVCRRLEIGGREYAERNDLLVSPAFINAGDGKHEHPTQELLDDFTFLEFNNWNYDHLHIALVGDLKHGRTVHSKVDGLKIFNNVDVDLIAPTELQLQDHYVDRMKENGYNVRIFGSIEEYLGQDKKADKWYFTRPQLERMGADVLEKADKLKKAVTWRKEFMDSIDVNDTKFFHPLPRKKDCPTIPFWVDDTPLNGYERQSANGYITRIVLLGLVAGKIGQDFEGESAKKPEFIDDFIEEVSVASHHSSEYPEGIKNIERGIVIDHIMGESYEDAHENVQRTMRILNIYGRGGSWIDDSSDRGNPKGKIKLPGVDHLGEKQLKRLAAVSPGCTVNFIDGFNIVKKLRLNMPPRIYNFDDLSCRNDACITHPSHNEGAYAEFHRDESNTFICAFCDTSHTYKQIWGGK